MKTKFYPVGLLCNFVNSNSTKFSILFLFLLVTSTSSIFGQKRTTLANNIQALYIQGGNSNDHRPNSVLIQRNAFTIDGVNYDVLFTIGQRYGSRNAQMRLAEPNAGLMTMQWRNGWAFHNATTKYRMTVVESGSATPSNLTGTPVAIDNFTLILPDIDGNGTTGTSPKYVDIAGYKVTSGSAPTVTVNGTYLAQRNFYTNPSSDIAQESIDGTADYIKFRANPPATDASDNILTSTIPLFNPSRYNYGITMHFDQFPTTGIELMFGFTIDETTIGVDGSGNQLNTQATRAIFHLFEVEDTPILPVKLSSFTSNILGNNKVQLNWETASELNNKGFELQRSSDGNSWTTLSFIGTAAPNGTSSSNNKYEYTDQNPFDGTNYYRLKQIDIDGKFDYSTILLVNMAGKPSVKIFPNPTSNFINITGIQGSAKIKIYNISGSLIMEKTMNNSNEKISLDKFSNGIYHVQIIDKAGEVSTFKVVKN